jgi:tricarballylate dehydrogenase
MKKVIVVGTGNAAFCSAIAASEQGAKVLMLEAGTKEQIGGNSCYSAGAFRFAYESKEQILTLLADKKDQRIPRTNFGSYTQKQFLQELREINENQGDFKKQQTLVTESFTTIAWLKGKGLKLEPIYHRQCFEVDGMLQFWGGLVLSTPQEGVGLIAMEAEIAQKMNVEIIYKMRAQKLITKNEKVIGVEALCGREKKEFFADAVVLACGGFEANRTLRGKYMGALWEKAKVRGTRHNQGDGILMSEQVGAKMCGKNDGCHAVFMDYQTPDYCEDVAHLDRKKYRKISYPFGIMLNAKGERFVDEGADFRNYTYAKYGKEVLKQPEQLAWQIFDAQVSHLLYDEYQMPNATRFVASSLKDLIQRIGFEDKTGTLKHILEYNRAVEDKNKFNPSIKDQRKTIGLKIKKSNWANKIEKPPFLAYKITCGITFTYMGLATNENQQVLNQANKPIAGLFAAGEMVGNIFYYNYPGGSGLTSGAIFGKIAGVSASKK